ncbi:hypothetical protein A2G07_07985 [Deinococcus radiodurans R1 = ATCC 13939 = DSM 20539]|nr:hypothetical protein A2G07_07985 [Deinococcus radiodurans R1 = ATCC 13939 = DSM 20539]
MAALFCYSASQQFQTCWLLGELAAGFQAVGQGRKTRFICPGISDDLLVITVKELPFTEGLACTACRGKTNEQQD